MPAFIDLTGSRFGRLLVIERGPNAKHNMPRWRCRCDCGNETLSWGQALRDGYAQSCGCLNREAHTERIGKLNLRHGESGKIRSELYKAWRAMMGRCYETANSGYPKYGAKGITVCDRWHTYENFRDDMQAKPAGNLTLDRIDYTKGYSKENCRWATMKEQQNNRSNNVRLTFGGETLTISQWADKLGVKQATLSARIRQGWSIEETLTTPIVFGKKRPKR